MKTYTHHMLVCAVRRRLSRNTRSLLEATLTVS